MLTKPLPRNHQPNNPTTQQRADPTRSSASRLPRVSDTSRATAATGKSTDRRFDWHGSLRSQAGTVKLPLHVTLCAHGARMRRLAERPKAKKCERKKKRTVLFCAFLVGASAQLLCWAGFRSFAQVGLRQALRPLSFAVFCGIADLVSEENLMLLGNWGVLLVVLLTRCYIHYYYRMHFALCK